MTQLGEAQKNKLKALVEEFKRLQKQLQDIHKKTATKTSNMEYWRSKSPNTRSTKLLNTPA
jgi:hypothetical protein